MLLSRDPGWQALGADLTSPPQRKSKFALQCLRQAMVHVEMTRQGLLTFFALCETAWRSFQMAMAVGSTALAPARGSNRGWAFVSAVDGQVVLSGARITLKPVQRGG